MQSCLHRNNILLIRVHRIFPIESVICSLLFKIKRAFFITIMVSLRTLTWFDHKLMSEKYIGSKSKFIYHDWIFFSCQELCQWNRGFIQIKFCMKSYNHEFPELNKFSQMEPLVKQVLWSSLLQRDVSIDYHDSCSYDLREFTDGLTLR